jgi:hypothetical protein
VNGNKCAQVLETCVIPLWRRSQCYINLTTQKTSRLVLTYLNFYLEKVESIVACASTSWCNSDLVQVRKQSRHHRLPFQTARETSYRLMRSCIIRKQGGRARINTKSVMSWRCKRQAQPLATYTSRHPNPPQQTPNARGAQQRVK